LSQAAEQENRLNTWTTFHHLLRYCRK